MENLLLQGATELLFNEPRPLFKGVLHKEASKKLFQAQVKLTKVLCADELRQGQIPPQPVKAALGEKQLKGAQGFS